MERLTGVHRDTIMRLAIRVGIGCAKLHDRLMRDLYVSRCELDEAWGYVGKKRMHLKDTDPPEFGDQYTFIALDATSKGIISYRVGKRTSQNTHLFVQDLRRRIANEPEISSDAWVAYPKAVEDAFGHAVNFGTIDKVYAVPQAVEAARRYSPAQVVAVKYANVLGRPRHICTSYVERQNLSLRMSQRRFTRLTNAFSRKLENHMAAVALYVAHYNLCRIHEAIRITPAMHLRVTDRVWTVRELVQAALDGALPEEPAGKRSGPFRVIDGGRA
ncbi:MAG TPA: IS1 family transposase [Rhizomicrobium sp.]|nr:IS1 family transposase [Rhizomicrobium sp.]